MLNMILPLGSLAVIVLLLFIALTGKTSYFKERHLKKELKRGQKNQRFMQQSQPI